MTLVAASAGAATDSDGDGMVDEWEVYYFGSTNAPGAGASQDYDLDGVSNMGEYRAGTSPTNRQSRLAFNLVEWVVPSKLRMQWPVATGRVYNVETIPAPGAAFTGLAMNLPATPPQNLYTAAVGTARHAFYRVRVRPMFVGAANTVPGGSGLNYKQSWDLLDTAVGPLGCRRSYSSGLVTNFLSTVAAIDAGKRASVFSFKTDWTMMALGQHSNDVWNLVQSIPAGHLAYLCWFHEPENDGSAAAFVPAFQQFSRAVRAANRPNVKVTLILMTWTWNPASGRNPADWWPGAEYVDAVGLDGYNPYDPAVANSKWKTFSTIFETAVDWMRGRGVKEVGVAEFGCKERTGDVNAKANWLLDAAGWADAQRLSFVCYFDSDVGDSAGAGWWLRTSTNATQTFREIAASHR